MRQLNAAGMALIHTWEGDKLKAYQDGGGVWTIGTGHTGPDVHPGMEITEEEGLRLFNLDLAEHCIEPLLNGCPTNDSQYGAMTSLCFNIGFDHFRNSTVLKRHLQGNKSAAANAFLLWRFIAGKPSQGLLNRREQERKLYLS